MKESGKQKRGPKPEFLKIQGDWREAMKKAVRKPTRDIARHKVRHRKKPLK